MQSQALEDPRRAKITGELPSRARPRAVTGQRHLQCLAICDALPEQCRQRVGVQRQADVAAQSPGEAPRNERTEHWPGGWRKTRHPSADVQCHLAPVTFSPRPPRHANAARFGTGWARTRTAASIKVGHSRARSHIHQPQRQCHGLIAGTSSASANGRPVPPCQQARSWACSGRQRRQPPAAERSRAAVTWTSTPTS